MEVQRPLADHAVDAVRRCRRARRCRQRRDRGSRARALLLSVAPAFSYSALTARTNWRDERKLRSSASVLSAVSRASQVGVDVAAAEAVDRLLRIADHDEAARERAESVGCAVDAIEDRVLLQVGILEFVDQRDRPRREQAVGQRGAAGAVQAAIRRVRSVRRTSCAPLAARRSRQRSRNSSR